MLKKSILMTAVVMALSACAADGGNVLKTTAQQSLEAGKNTAINTGVNAISGKLTGTSTATMTDIGKDALNSGKNAAIQKATDILTVPAGQ